MKKRILTSLAVAIALATTAALVTSQTDGTTKTLMKAKTAYAHRLLDAVVLEDFDVMQDQAFRLKAVAETADWYTAESSQFVRETESFIRAADRLFLAAKENNGDAAALAYLDLTLSCVHCHRYLKSSQ